MTVRNYAILFPKARSDGGGVSIMGGNASVASGIHALDGAEHTDRDSYVKSTLGGEAALIALGSVSGTATVDLTLGNYAYGTLTGDTTFTFSGARSGYGDGFTLELAGDFTPTWPGSVVTIDTDPATGTRVWVFLTRDGGTTWLGFLAGGGGTAAQAAMVPFQIDAGETFTVPAKKQALYTHAITVDGAIVVNGILLYVN